MNDRGRRFFSYVLTALIAGAVGGAVALGLANYYPAPQETPVPRLNLSVNTSLETVVEQAYSSVAPSVVHITSTVLTRNFFFEIIPQTGTGSGVVVDKEGYILTNNHVIQDAESIKVTLSNGKEYDGNLVGADPETDVAVIKINAPSSELQPARLGDSGSVRIGMLVIAIGNPFGLDRTATLGIVSALNRSITTNEGSTLSNIIQTDASINPGNSGGPLINLQGEVIGINTAIISPSGGSVGIGFAIPVNTAKEVMEYLLKEGKKNPTPGRAWLGIRGYTVDSELSKLLNLPVKEGVMIAEVDPGGPAAKSGLRGGSVQIIINNRFFTIGGDIITKVDGNRIASMEGLVGVISSHKPGDKVEVTYIREGQVHTVKVVLGERKR
jgi:putative serine protease PepD